MLDTHTSYIESVHFYSIDFNEFENSKDIIQSNPIQSKSQYWRLKDIDRKVGVKIGLGENYSKKINNRKKKEERGKKIGNKGDKVDIEEKGRRGYRGGE